MATLEQIKNQIENAFNTSIFSPGCWVRHSVLFDANGNPLPARSDADGVLKVLAEGMYDGTTRTPIAVDITGKLLSSAAMTAYVDGVEALLQDLKDLFKWQFMDELVDGGYTYYGYYSPDDNLYRIIRVEDVTAQTRRTSGSGTLPAEGSWSGLSYS